MTRNVGKTTAFHGLEAIESFKPQGCEQGGDLDRNADEVIECSILMRCMGSR